MTDRVRFGVIGYAHPHAPKYAAAIAACPRAELAGIAGPGVNPDLAAEEAERYGVPGYADYRDLLARDDRSAERSQRSLAGVYVGTEPTRHLEVVSAAAARGVHVLCDKPLATTLDDADAIVRIAREAGVKLMVPFNPRFQLPLMKAKERLDAGQAGELISVFAIKYGKVPTLIPGTAQYDWLLDPARAGGGGFFDIGIHAVDALRWLAGSEARRVYARIGTVLHPELPCDDLGLVTIEFENGVVGTLSAGWANPPAYPTWLDVRFEILTTKTAFLVDSPYHDFTVYSEEKVSRRSWWRRDIAGLVKDFVEAIVEDREPAITGEDGRAALAITLAAYESAHTGRVVSVAG